MTVILFMMSFVFQGAKSITTFEILPQPPPSRGNDNPWPTFPRVFKVDYGHEEVKVKFGKDPRAYSTLTKVKYYSVQSRIWHSIYKSGANVLNSCNPIYKLIMCSVYT